VKSLILSLSLLVCAARPSIAVSAPKTDVVVLKNGDHITGEVKGLEYGRLKYSTDNIGTIYIEWEDIATLTAARTFELENFRGDIYHGSIGAGSEPGTFELLNESGSLTMRFDELVRVVPVSQGWIEGIDGSLNLGLSYVRATELGQLTLSGNAIQRHAQIEKELSLAWTYTREPEQNDTNRYTAGFVRRKLMAHRTYWYANLGIASNSEIGLNFRGLVGGGVGMDFVQTYSSQFSGLVGLAASRENPTGEDASTTNLEAVIGLGYRVATYDFPKTKINIALTVYPGLSPSGRARATLDGSFSRELFKDFTWGITVYDDYDSEPRDETAQTNDYGVTMTVGWEF
jgi:Protein of unknown function, DUF481